MGQVVGPLSGADANREIVIPTVDVRIGVGDQQPHVEIGNQLAEAGEPLHQPLLGESGVSGQEKPPSALAADRRQRCCNVSEARCHAGPQAQSFVGQNEAVVVALEKRAPHRRLDCPDVTADGRLTDSQLVGRARKTQEPRRALEDHERVGVGNLATQIFHNLRLSKL